MYNDIHQWYLAVDEAIPTVEKYENAILKFFKTLKIDVSKRLLQPFLSKFYLKEKFSKHAVSLAASKLGSSFGLAFTVFLISYIYKCITDELGFLDSLKTNWPFAAIIAGISFFVFEVGSMLITYLSYKSQVKTLQKYENELNDIMISLPSNYRNSEKMYHIAQVYYHKKGVAPEVAFDVADQMYSNSKPIIGVFFDLPFRNDFVVEEEFSQGQQVIEKTEEEKIKDNPNLPADIEGKTFNGSDDAKKDLDSMIGLASVKDQIEKLENRIKFYGEGSSNGNHMAFVGSAGTGKTTVARIVTKILFDLGYIKKNQYVEISGDYLRAGTTARVDAILEYSMGGVLFIDEAYMLYEKNGYGADATGILLKAMEDHRKDFVCILAGYEEQMTRLIASNEGFSSRIKHTIYFQDYTVDEMFDIFKYFISKYNGKSYTISEDAIPTLLEAFKLEKQAKSFGNARTVRNAVDSIMDYYVDRSINSNTDTGIILIEDVEKYFADRKVALQHELKNASAANQVDESIIRLSELKSKVKEGSENPDADFRKLVGLESFTKEIEILKNQKEFYNNATAQKILFIGEKGCGKSSLAKILTGYLYTLGYIAENKYLDISAEFLKGSYVGHTTKRAEAIVSYATGGVLFINNINMMANSDDSFSTEVLSVISNALESNLNIIISDTDSPYLRSISGQFNIVYEFPKYNGEQLTKIFMSKASEDNFTVTQAAIDKVYSILENKNSTKDVINLYNNSKKKHISNFTEETKYILDEQDIEKPVMKFNLH